MTTNERAAREFASILEPGEEVLYTGLCMTGYSTLNLLLLGVLGQFLIPFLARLFGRKGEPYRRWRLALTDRRIVLLPLGSFLPGRSKPGEERSYRYTDIARVEKGKYIMGATLRLWTPQGEGIQIQLPKARNNAKALEEALRQAAPQLASS